MAWEVVAAVAAVVSAVLTALGVRARRRPELAKRPLAVLGDWTTKTRRDASGLLRISVYVTIRDAVGIPTIIHRVVARTIGGFPPGFTEPGEDTRQVIQEPVLVYGDELVEGPLFLGWAFVRQVPSDDGRRLWIATGRVDYTFSAERGGRPQDWSVTFRIIHHSNPPGELPCFVATPETSARPRRLGYSALRDLWERWKRWNCRVREMR